MDGEPEHDAVRPGEQDTQSEAMAQVDPAAQIPAFVRQDHAHDDDEDEEECRVCRGPAEEG